jgi:hypothetical protein
MIFLVKEDFSLLVQHNIMDELIKVVEHVDTIHKASYEENTGTTIIPEINSNETKAVSEREVDGGESDDDDEEEDYEFESSNEEHDDSDTDDEEEEHSTIVLWRK